MTNRTGGKVRGKRLVAGTAMVTMACAALVGAPMRAGATDVPTVSVADVSIAEGDAGAAPIRVPVDLSAPSSTTIKVPYTIIASSDGTADAADARLLKGTVTFLAGVVSKYVKVTAYGDRYVEPNQHVQVVLGTPIGDATIEKGIGLVTLIDDDNGSTAPTPITVSIGDVNIVEGDQGTRTAYMPVLLSQPAQVQTKVLFNVDCSAAALLGEASLKMHGALTFQAGQRSKAIPLNIQPDTSPEEILAIYQTITSSLAAVKVLYSQGDVTIQDDDGGMPMDPGHRVPNRVTETLPSGSTFDAQAVGDKEMIDQTPEGVPGTFPYNDPQGGSVILRQSPLSLSHDGRYAAFISPQSDLVPGDTNGLPDVFVRDRATGTTERVDLRYDGTEIQKSDFPGGPDYPMHEGQADSDVSISADGRYVAYNTYAALDPTDSTAMNAPWTSYSDVYLYDRVLHTTELVSVDTAGTPLHGALTPTVSAHGRYVTFSGGVGSSAVYVRDRVLLTTTLVYDSANFWYHSLTMSANGRFVVTPSLGNGCFDQALAVIDLQDGSVERVDVNDEGEGGWKGNEFQNEIYTPAISGDGRFIAFKSNAWNLIPGMTGPNHGYSGAFDDSTVRTYVRDLALKSTTMLSPGKVFFDESLSISDDGNLVAQSNIMGGPAVLYDRAAGTSESVGFPYSHDHINTWVNSSSLSGDGRYLGFVSEYYVVYDTIVLTDAWAQRVR